MSEPVLSPRALKLWDSKIAEDAVCESYFRRHLIVDDLPPPPFWRRVWFWLTDVPASIFRSDR